MPIPPREKASPDHAVAYNARNDRTVEKLLRQQAALATFGSFAFKENDLSKILNEAARVCALSLGVPFCKVCRYRESENDLLIVAGCGWSVGVVGRVVSQADETSPQGRAYITCEPVVIPNLQEANNLALPEFYPQHGIISTVDVVIPAVDGAPYGVLEIDSPVQQLYDLHDINFLTGFANVLAEAVAAANKNAAMARLVAQQTLLAEELQHRVRNNLQMVSAMLATYARSAPDEDSRTNMASMSRRVMTLAQIYDSLLGVGLAERVDLSRYLRELCASLPGLQDQPASNISLTFEGDATMLPLDAVTSLGLAVAELVTNCYNHAFPLHEGTIAVELSRYSSDGRAKLIISDDGIGFIENPNNMRRGIRLVRRLIANLGGSLDMRSEKGTHWSMSFPVPPEDGKLQTAA